MYVAYICFLWVVFVRKLSFIIVCLFAILCIILYCIHELLYFPIVTYCLSVISVIYDMYIILLFVCNDIRALKYDCYERRDNSKKVLFVRVMRWHHMTPPRLAECSAPSSPLHVVRSPFLLLRIIYPSPASSFQSRVAWVLSNSSKLRSSVS